MIHDFVSTINLPKAAALAMVVGVAACGGTTTESTETTEGTETADATEEATGDGPSFESQVALTGAGASFPAPLYQNWFVELNEEVPDLQVNYQSVGSGAGVEQFLAGTVNFGASDVAMTDEEISQVERGVILLPMTAGAIVLSYNLPGVEELNLPRDVYPAILNGEITTWNDPAIADANPDVELPDTPITVVHRSDGSGTTGVFTMHLSDISDNFEKSIGQGKTVEWPGQGTFVGAKGNEGITAQVQQTEGAIGYVEYGYATENGLAVAALENASGNYVTPSGDSAAATLDAVELPENLRAFITDPEGDNSYPIVTYTWMLMYEEYDDPEIAKGIEVMVEYGLNQGQEVAPELGYISMPQSVRERVAEAADGISDEYEITLN